MIPTGTRIWIVAGTTDLRRGFVRLSAMVQTVSRLKCRGRRLINCLSGNSTRAAASGLAAGSAGRQARDRELLAGESTLNRLELTPATYSAEALDALLVDLFLEAHVQAPRQIVLDLDATDTPLHDQQEARFFHGYYNQYCYLPLYIFCQDHLLCARLRPSNQDASAGSRAEVERIVGQIRQRWPQTRIVLRADSGFCREELMARCEKHSVDDVFGLARNPRLAPRSTGTSAHRPADAGLCRVLLSYAGELVPLPAGGGQGRVSGQGREPALPGQLAERRRIRSQHAL